MEIVTERVEIPLSAGGHMGGYLARPKGAGPWPGVIVYMEIFGINSHIRDVTECARTDGQRRTLRRHATALWDACEATLTRERDLALIRGAYHAVLARLDGRPPSPDGDDAATPAGAAPQR